MNTISSRFSSQRTFQLASFFYPFLLGKRSFILSQEISHQDLITAAMNEAHKQKTDGNYPISCSNINSKNESWRECFNKEKKKQAKTFQLTKRVHFDMQTKFNVKLHKLDQWLEYCLWSKSGWQRFQRLHKRITCVIYDQQKVCLSSRDSSW